MPADPVFILHFKRQTAWATWLPYINNNKGWICHSQGKTFLQLTNTHTLTHIPTQLMTCSDSLAHRTVCRLYGQLLITKPLDSFCLYLVLSPSWLWVSSGLQKGLFPYLGCRSLHPWRDKGRQRLCLHHSPQERPCLGALPTLLLVVVVRQRSRFGCG